MARALDPLLAATSIGEEAGGAGTRRVTAPPPARRVAPAITASSAPSASVAPVRVRRCPILPAISACSATRCKPATDSPTEASAVSSKDLAFEGVPLLRCWPYKGPVVARVVSSFPSAQAQLCMPLSTQSVAMWPERKAARPT